MKKIVLGVVCALGLLSVPTKSFAAANCGVLTVRYYSSCGNYSDCSYVLCSDGSGASLGCVSGPPMGCA